MDRTEPQADPALEVCPTPEEVSAYVHGETGDAARDPIEAHRVRCPTCRRMASFSARMLAAEETPEEARPAIERLGPECG